MFLHNIFFHSGLHLLSIFFNCVGKKTFKKMKIKYILLVAHASLKNFYIFHLRLRSAVKLVISLQVAVLLSSCKY